MAAGRHGESGDIVCPKAESGHGVWLPVFKSVIEKIQFTVVPDLVPAPDSKPNWSALLEQKDAQHRAVPDRAGVVARLGAHGRCHRNDERDLGAGAVSEDLQYKRVLEYLSRYVIR